MPDELTPGAPPVTALFARWGADPARIPELERQLAASRRRADREPVERLARHVWIRTLYEDFGSGVFRYARSMARSDADAEEVVQQTFIDADQKIDTYDRSVGSARAWLFCFARGRALNLTRSRRRLLAHEEPAGDALPDRATAPHDTPRRIDVARALRSLDETLHDVWWFCRVEELTQAEVAVMLAIPAGTVATRLRRADEQMREALRERDATPLLALPIALGAAEVPLPADLVRIVDDLKKPALDAPHRERLWKRIEERLRRSAHASARAIARAAAALRPRGMQTLTHAVALAIGLTAGLAVRPRQHPAAPRVALQTAPLLATSAPAPGPSPLAMPVAQPPPRDAPQHLAEARHAPRAPRDTEHHMRQARAALLRGDARDANAALDAAERSLGPSESREYIESLRIEALLLAGDRERAEQRLSALRARYPESAHLPRLERWLASR